MNVERTYLRYFRRRHDTQHNDTQHNDTQHNVVYCYAECHLCSLSIMLCVANKPIGLSVIMLYIVMLSAVGPFRGAATAQK
jgi:hypothetical protein